MCSEPQAPTRGAAAPTEKHLQHWLLAIVPPLVALAVRVWLGPHVGSSVWFLFYPALFLSFWIGGVRGGLLATALSATSVLWFFVPPEQSFLKPPGLYFPAAVFLLTSLLFALFHDRLRKADLVNAAARLASERASELRKTTDARSIAVLERARDEAEASRRQLRRAKEEFASLVEQAPDGIFLADLDGRYTDVNRAGCRMLGSERDELVGRLITDLLPPEQAPLLWQSREKLLAGEPQTGEWTLRRKDGSCLPVEVSAKILPDGRWQGFVRDITVRKRLEEELRRVESEQRFLAEVGAALASTLDYEEIPRAVARLLLSSELADLCIVEILEERGQVRRWFTAARDPRQAPIAKALEQVELDRQRPYLASAVFATHQPVLINEVTPEYLDAIAQSDAHRRLLHQVQLGSLLGLPLLAHGRLIGSLVLLRTTGSHRYSEQDLPFASKVALRAALAVDNARLYRTAQRAIRARDDLLGVVAHDLRNPLSTILMQTALLRRRGKEPERRSGKPLEAIERAATRMSRLIQDLLDLTRIDADSLSVEHRPVSAPQLVTEAVQAEEALAASAGIVLRLDLAPDLPQISADRDRLLQVFENLLGNAVKFTPRGGTITLGAAPRDREVLFWVADTGAGIPAEHLPHLFERFWQASTGSGGAGLGLPIVKGIVEAHGGKIWVESSPGRGSIFFFTIPAAPRIAEDRTAPPDR